MRKSRSRVGSRGVAGVAALTAMAVTTFVPAALAGGHKASSSLGYAGPSGTQSSLSPPTRTPAGAQAAKGGGSTLPYTGADIALIGGAGVVLIGFGVGVTALSRRAKARV